jgi:uncharacterized protein YndB with AHSA1/START domain
MNNPEIITVETTVDAGLNDVWRLWTEPEHIKKWNSASDDWHTPHTENDLREGGKFISTMEAKDESAGFDFGGTYTEIKPQQHLAYTLDDGRKVAVDFKKEDDKVKITETFEPEEENSADMQRDGWQAILDSFKRYVEENQ